MRNYQQRCPRTRDSPTAEPNEYYFETSDKVELVCVKQHGQDKTINR